MSQYVRRSTHVMVLKLSWAWPLTNTPLDFDDACYAQWCWGGPSVWGLWLVFPNNNTYMCCLICFPLRVTTQKIIYSSHIANSSPHTHYHPYCPTNIHHVIHIVSQTYTIWESTCQINIHTHIFDTYDKYTHCLIHIKATKTYASHGGTRLFELCPLLSGVSLNSPWTNEFPDLLSCSHNWAQMSVMLQMDLIDQGIRDGFW
jgi:hypothetical protein